MRKTLLIFWLLSSSILLKAQYCKDYIKSDDILKALSSIGVNIYKYALTSNEIFNFNILFEEYSQGKCIDSTLLVTDDNIQVFKNLLQKSLIIQKDTTYLSIFVHQKFDSTYILNIDYSFFSTKKEIEISNLKYGQHKIREFPSPKISTQGIYPILILSLPWNQVMNGIEVERFCFPENIEIIKKMVTHFYVLSIIANR
jgi:hypothetical protein